MGEHTDSMHNFRVQGPSIPPEPRKLVLHELSVEAARELDRRATEEYGIPSIVLMENAAIGLFNHATEMINNVADPSVLIMCGPGNNGGDGFALARHLHNAKIPVTVVLTREPRDYTGEAAINLRVIERMKFELRNAETVLRTEPDAPPTLIVDALFGAGLNRPVEGVASELIAWMNRARVRNGSRTLAVDTPSGLDMQSGRPLGQSVVRADRTATFAGLKPGMSRIESLDYVGDVHVVPIGAPIQLLDELGTVLEPKSMR
ncbi:MAG: NAD(P)H-hydrate epimerase [Phycisphaerales bacterium]